MTKYLTRDIENNTMYFDGCNLVSLAKKYETPLYVVSENEIVSRVEEFRRAFTNRYPNTRIAYASKAFSSVAMFKLCMEQGICIDVVSGGELYTAMKAGFPPERVEFNGNNKSRRELIMALDYGVGRIIVDGEQEFELLSELCRQKNIVADILFRITPGVDSHSHEYMVTGKTDSKFGVPLTEDSFYPLMEKAITSPYVNFMGLHFHVGSQIFDNSSHLDALSVTLNLVKNLRRRFGVTVTELNLGGGFGAVYTDEIRKPPEYFLEPMMERIDSFFSEISAERPSVVIEPGRSLIAEAGLTLYTIGNIKTISGVRKYVSVDGGMTDNIRPALYRAKYHGAIVNKAGERPEDFVTVAGKCCESGDILIKELKLANPEPGDILAVFSTGAYGYSMASNYNRHPIPAVVFVKDGKDRQVIRRQSYEDLLRNEIF